MLSVFTARCQFRIIWFLEEISKSICSKNDMKSAKFFFYIVALIGFANGQNQFRQALQNLENFETFPIRAISNFLNPQQRKPNQRNGDNVYVYHETSYEQPVYEQTPSYQLHSQSGYGQNSNQPSSSSCDQFWSLRRDYELFGIVTIPNPDRQKSVLRLTLTLNAQLPSVSSRIVSINMSQR
jgi:hypothetical protein